MSTREYNLTLNFQTMDALQKHIEMMDDFINWRETRLQKKMTDKRGRHIALYHQLARDYHKEHPDIPYRECLKQVSKPKEIKET